MITWLRNLIYGNQFNEKKEQTVVESPKTDPSTTVAVESKVESTIEPKPKRKYTKKNKKAK